MDDGYPYYPEPCTKPGHDRGCPGRAGGEHQVDMPRDRAMSNEARLALGQMIFDRYLSGSPENGDRDEATAWLQSLGFDRIEWVQGNLDDVLILLLWRFFALDLVDEFIIKFSGFDAAIIGVFNLVEEVSL